MKGTTTPPSLLGSALLLAEPGRLKMLWALLDRRAYTAGELAIVADLSASSTSMHLAKLLEASWITVTRRGRHRYYTIADDTVAHAVEAVGAIRLDGGTARTPARPRPGLHLQRARSCYGHLAGEVAVNFWSALLEHDWVHRDGRRFALRAYGIARLAELMKCPPDDSVLQAGLKPCMDWTERKFHLGGALGVRVFRALQQRGWVKPMPRSRLVVFAPGKEQALVRLTF
jgi:DNA-binding transcriptional ArsR family regulator